jgi:type I restriction enzyme S subunit
MSSTVIASEARQSSWRECKLGDVIEIIGGGTPKTSIAEYWNGNIPWLSVVDFNSGKKYVSKTEKTITEEGLKNSSTKLLQKNDIIISARGTVGALAMLDKPMTFNQSCYGIRAKENESTNDYIFYLLKDTVNQLLQISHGGVFDTITRATFDEIDISLPPLEEQKRIAEVLSGLDDKIDLLHRQNRTLESLAQTLFRQWFIEEAKEEWEKKPLKDVCEIINGFAFKSGDYREGGRTIVRTMNFKNGFIDSGDVVYIGIEEEIKYTKYQLQKNDFLLVMVGSLGNYAIVTSDILPALQNQNMWNFRTLGKITQHYLNYAMRQIVEENISSASGSAREFFQKGQFYEFMITVPDDETMQIFNDNMEDFYSKIENNRRQIQTLENLRDTLLPKLLSGEVRVER